MGRVARHGIALLVAVLLLGPGCSAGDKSPVEGGSASTTPGDPGATIAGPADPSGPTDPSDPAATVEDGSADPATVPGSPPGASPGTPSAAQVATAAGGWRLAVTEPETGATVGRSTVLCYEVSGPSPAARVELDVAVGAGAPVRVAGAMGRGSARVDLKPDPDPHDLRVQLVADGKRLDGATVTIPAILVVPAAADPDCP